MTPTQALTKAIRLGGGISEFARKLGVRYQAVQKWRRIGVTSERAAEIEILLNGAVSRRDLLPTFPWDEVKPPKRRAA